MKRRLKDDVFLSLVSAGILLLDQLSKYAVRANLPVGQVYRPELWLSRYMRLVHMQNSGATAGILQGWNGLFIVLAVLGSLAIIYFYPRAVAQGRPAQLALALLLGGALGNLIDRLLLGHVTDFLSIGGLPAGNLADLSLLAGVALLLVGASGAAPGKRTQY